MRFLGFRKEKRIRGFVAGADEAGRGSLAGPVVASAVVIKDFKCIRGVLRETNDSKKLSLKKREEIFNAIMEEKNIEWGIGVVSSKIIDKTDILSASKKAMEKAINKLNLEISHIILDGNFKINIDIPQESIIGGDGKIFSCALASIIAKVYRDRLMIKTGKKYSNYNFASNKGYGTNFHIRQIRKYGYSDIHRKSFKIS